LNREQWRDTGENHRNYELILCINQLGLFTPDSDVGAAHLMGQKFNIFRKHLMSHVPSGYVKIAIENGHRNSGFSH